MGLTVIDFAGYRTDGLIRWKVRYQCETGRSDLGRQV